MKKTALGKKNAHNDFIAMISSLQVSLCDATS